MLVFFVTKLVPAFLGNIYFILGLVKNNNNKFQNKLASRVVGEFKTQAVQFIFARPALPKLIPIIF